MSYVLWINGRYVCEHACGHRHYGNQAVVRNCCVQDAFRLLRTSLRVAWTDYHPSYRAYLAATNDLNDAELQALDALWDRESTPEERWLAGEGWRPSAHKTPQKFLE